MDSEYVQAFSKRRGFYWPSYEIYGGSRGFYDYGPMGSMLLHNMIERWRKLYVVEEGLLEISSPVVGLESVFQASGHLGEFTDYLVSCEECKDVFRADHLLEDIVDNPDSLEREELAAVLKEKSIVCPSCSGGLSSPEAFNLMFKTTIGPGGGRTGYLRPETAQGIFLAFGDLSQQARKRLPFGVVQIGRGYRNEISPRQGLLRQREFNMAEAEVFFHPDEKVWPGTTDVMETLLKLVTEEGIEEGISAGEAVQKGIIGCSALGYFVALTQRFLLDVGVDPKRLRFRQHRKTEMAHYASDCWDAEALLSYGWVELVGIADRGCYDLGQHMEHSGVDMRVFVAFEEPRKEHRIRIVPDLKKLGPIFRNQAKDVASAMEESHPVEGGISVTVNGDILQIPGDCYSIEEGEVVVSGEKVIPHVVEPSYGLDRIFYTVLEHNLCVEEKSGEEYRVLRIPLGMAPVKAGVFPLMSKPELEKVSLDIARNLRRKGITVNHDSSGSIGRRYARADEVGTPWCITVDYESLEDHSATVRNRDSGEQERVAIASMAEHILCLME